MKKNILVILLILILPVITYFMLNLSNTSTAKTTAAIGKPQVLKFTSQMCLDCQTMNKVFKEIFPKHKEKIILTEIHVQDKNPNNESLIEMHKVTLVPTIILINSNGTIIKRIEGAIPAVEMDKYLEELE